MDRAAPYAGMGAGWDEAAQWVGPARERVGKGRGAARPSGDHAINPPDPSFDTDGLGGGALHVGEETGRRTGRRDASWAALVREREAERRLPPPEPTRELAMSRAEREAATLAYDPLQGRYRDSARERRVREAELALVREQAARKPAGAPPEREFNILTGVTHPGGSPPPAVVTRGSGSVRRRTEENRRSDIFTAQYKKPDTPKRAESTARSKERRDYDILAQTGQETYVSPRIVYQQEKWKEHHKQRYDVVGARYYDDAVDAEVAARERTLRDAKVTAKQQALPRVYKEAPGRVFDVVGHHVLNEDAHKHWQAEEGRKDALRKSTLFDEKKFVSQREAEEERRHAMRMKSVAHQRYVGHGYNVLTGKEAGAGEPLPATTPPPKVWDKLAAAASPGAAAGAAGAGGGQPRRSPLW